jgi:hypothetical protein
VRGSSSKIEDLLINDEVVSDSGSIARLDAQALIAIKPICIETDIEVNRHIRNSTLRLNLHLPAHCEDSVVETAYCKALNKYIGVIATSGLKLLLQRIELEMKIYPLASENTTSEMVLKSLSFKIAITLSAIRDAILFAINHDYLVLLYTDLPIQEYE